ncbi:MAG: hypothetical protein H0U57_09745 [Tatlockia sp.]|nr:hypothetical protein [Tatlockia sp.]
MFLRNNFSLFKIATFLLTILFTAVSFSTETPIFDYLGRLIRYPGKEEIVCPVQNSKTGVILAIGQSNAANHAEKRMVTKYPTKVVNYFNGKCYQAASPLLGATGDEGEFLTPLADDLIGMGVYEQVVIVLSGMDGTPIAYWQKGAVLNQMLLKVVDELKQKYQITEIIWHQGETDVFAKTSKDQYVELFNSLISSLRPSGLKTPPIYYAIATLCGPKWYSDNPVAKAQLSLASIQDKIYLAANTDQLVPFNERYGKPYPCHFTEVGQKKVAYTFAQAIAKNKAVPNT